MDEMIQILLLLIHLLEKPATPKQIAEMLQANRFFIKIVVDIHRQLLAGGGEMHTDCEIILLDNGSEQENIWGASWEPNSQEIFYESMINLRPRQNRAMQILDPMIREQVKQIINRLLGGI
jgi:hypothetical protein